MKKIVFLLLTFLVLIVGASPVIAKEFEERKITDDKKTWEVFMTSQVKKNSVSGNVYIMDQYGKKVKTEVSIDGKRIIVKPTESYKQNSRYRLFVSKKVTSIDDISLEEDVILPFRYTAPSAIQTVKYDNASYFIRVEVKTIGRAQNVKINNKPMHYIGKRKFELGLVNIKPGDKITISAYDISGKLIETKKDVVEVSR